MAYDEYYRSDSCYDKTKIQKRFAIPQNCKMKVFHIADKNFVFFSQRSKLKVQRDKLAPKEELIFGENKFRSYDMPIFILDTSLECLQMLFKVRNSYI